MSSSDDSQTELLREVSRELQVQNDRIQTNEENRQLQAKVERSENAHLLVSLGVLSALITYSMQGNGLELRECITGLSGPVCAVKLTAFISVFYLPGKLLVTTLLPVADSEWVEKTNDLLLPSIHVFLFISILFLLPIYLLFPDYQIKYFSIKFIALAVLASIGPAYRYTQRYGSAMEKVRTASTRRNIIVTSSGAQSDGKIRLTNPNSKPIPNDEVTLSIDEPAEVDVTIRQTISGDNENERKPATDVPANSVMDLPVIIDVISESNDVSGEVEIAVDIPDQPVQIETLSFGLEEDHSGATNIG